MKWFFYSQNNSGGFFQTPAQYVWIEAVDAGSANLLAIQHDLYFDGVDSGLDCECCGDRWSDVWRDDQGESTIKRYGEELTDELKNRIGSYLIVHADGRVEKGGDYEKFPEF